MSETEPPPTSVLWQHIADTNRAVLDIRDNIAAIRVDLAEKPCAVHMEALGNIKADVTTLQKWKDGLWMRIAAMMAGISGFVAVLIRAWK